MITQIDFNILDWIQTIRTPALDAFFSFVTHLGDEGIIWIVTAVIMLCFKKTRKCGIMMGVSLIIGTIIGNLALKNIIARERPFVQNPDMMKNLIIHAPSSYSFPSGHTLSSIESATAIFLCNKKWGIPAITLAFLIGISRCYLYVHFPTDVIVGAILGVCIGLFSKHIYNKIFYNKLKIGKFELY